MISDEQRIILTKITKIKELLDESNCKQTSEQISTAIDMLKELYVDIYSASYKSI